MFTISHYCAFLTTVHILFWLGELHSHKLCYLVDFQMPKPKVAESFHFNVIPYYTQMNPLGLYQIKPG